MTDPAQVTVVEAQERVRWRTRAYVDSTAATGIAADSFLQVHIRVGGVTVRRGDFPGSQKKSLICREVVWYGDADIP